VAVTTTTADPRTTAAGRPDTLGVLGGMGPLATVDFLAKLVALTPAGRDADHLPVLVYAVPQVPDRVAPILTDAGPSPLPALLAGVASLIAAGAKALALPCHTAHFWADALATAAGPVPLLHIADAAVAALTADGYAGGRIGVIGTRATWQAGFYQERLGRRGFDVRGCREAELTETVLPAIALVKQGQPERARPLFQRAIAALLADGADAVLLACTEIPAAFAEQPLPAHAVDGTAALARACVAWGLGQRT
jgi:aspartate racemase